MTCFSRLFARCLETFLSSCNLSTILRFQHPKICTAASHYHTSFLSGRPVAEQQSHDVSGTSWKVLSLLQVRLWRGCDGSNSPTTRKSSMLPAMLHQRSHLRKTSDTGKSISSEEQGSTLKPRHPPSSFPYLRTLHLFTFLTRCLCRHKRNQRDQRSTACDCVYT